MLPGFPFAMGLHRPYPFSVVSGAASSNGAVADAGKVRGPIIADVPLNQIRRPLLKTRSNNPDRVKALMESIAEIGLQEPIDVLEVDGVYYGIFFRDLGLHNPVLLPSNVFLDAIGLRPIKD
eukprot:c25941_g1_i2 orf=220-585(+)